MQKWFHKRRLSGGKMTVRKEEIGFAAAQVFLLGLGRGDAEVVPPTPPKWR
jgi:hypothetical protein